MEMRWSRGALAAARNQDGRHNLRAIRSAGRTPGCSPGGAFAFFTRSGPSPVAAMRKWRAEGKRGKGRGRGRWGRGCEFAIKGWITSGRAWCVFPRRGIRLSRTWFKIFPIARRRGMADVAVAATTPANSNCVIFPFLTARDKGERHVRSTSAEKVDYREIFRSIAFTERWGTLIHLFSDTGTVVKYTTK